MQNRISARNRDCDRGDFTPSGLCSEHDLLRPSCLPSVHFSPDLLASPTDCIIALRNGFTSRTIPAPRRQSSRNMQSPEAKDMTDQVLNVFYVIPGTAPQQKREYEQNLASNLPSSNFSSSTHLSSMACLSPERSRWEQVYAQASEISHLHSFSCQSEQQYQHVRQHELPARNNPVQPFPQSFPCIVDADVHFYPQTLDFRTTLTSGFCFNSFLDFPRTFSSSNTTANSSLGSSLSPKPSPHRLHAMIYKESFFSSQRAKNYEENYSPDSLSSQSKHGDEGSEQGEEIELEQPHVVTSSHYQEDIVVVFSISRPRSIQKPWDIFLSESAQLRRSFPHLESLLSSWRAGIRSEIYRRNYNKRLSVSPSDTKSRSSNSYGGFVMVSPTSFPSRNKEEENLSQSRRKQWRRQSRKERGVETRENPFFSSKANEISFSATTNDVCASPFAASSHFDIFCGVDPALLTTLRIEPSLQITHRRRFEKQFLHLFSRPKKSEKESSEKAKMRIPPLSLDPVPLICHIRVDPCWEYGPSLSFSPFFVPEYVLSLLRSFETSSHRYDATLDSGGKSIDMLRLDKAALLASAGPATTFLPGAASSGSFSGNSRVEKSPANNFFPLSLTQDLTSTYLRVPCVATHPLVLSLSPAPFELLSSLGLEGVSTSFPGVTAFALGTDQSGFLLYISNPDPVMGAKLGQIEILFGRKNAENEEQKGSTHASPSSTQIVISTSEMILVQSPTSSLLSAYTTTKKKTKTAWSSQSSLGSTNRSSISACSLALPPSHFAVVFVPLPLDQLQSMNVCVLDATVWYAQTQAFPHFRESNRDSLSPRRIIKVSSFRRFTHLSVSWRPFSELVQVQAWTQAQKAAYIPSSPFPLFQDIFLFSSIRNHQEIRKLARSTKAAPGSCVASPLHAWDGLSLTRSHFQDMVSIHTQRNFVVQKLGEKIDILDREIFDVLRTYLTQLTSTGLASSFNTNTTGAAMNRNGNKNGNGDESSHYSRRTSSASVTQAAESSTVVMRGLGHASATGPVFLEPYLSTLALLRIIRFHLDRIRVSINVLLRGKVQPPLVGPRTRPLVSSSSVSASLPSFLLSSSLEFAFLAQDFIFPRVVGRQERERELEKDDEGYHSSLSPLLSFHSLFGQSSPFFAVIPTFRENGERKYASKSYSPSLHTSSSFCSSTGPCLCHCPDSGLSYRFLAALRSDKVLTQGLSLATIDSILSQRPSTGFSGLGSRAESNAFSSERPDALAQAALALLDLDPENEPASMASMATLSLLGKDTKNSSGKETSMSDSTVPGSISSESKVESSLRMQSYAESLLLLRHHQLLRPLTVFSFTQAFFAVNLLLGLEAVAWSPIQSRTFVISNSLPLDSAKTIESSFLNDTKSDFPFDGHWSVQLSLLGLSASTHCRISHLPRGLSTILFFSPFEEGEKERGNERGNETSMKESLRGPGDVYFYCSCYTTAPFTFCVKCRSPLSPRPTKEKEKVKKYHHFSRDRDLHRMTISRQGALVCLFQKPQSFRALVENTSGMAFFSPLLQAELLSSAFLAQDGIVRRVSSLSPSSSPSSLALSSSCVTHALASCALVLPNASITLLLSSSLPSNVKGPLILESGELMLRILRRTPYLAHLNAQRLFVIQSILEGSASTVCSAPELVNFARTIPSATSPLCVYSLYGGFSWVRSDIREGLIESALTAAILAPTPDITNLADTFLKFLKRDSEDIGDKSDESEKNRNYSHIRSQSRSQSQWPTLVNEPLSTQSPAVVSILDLYKIYNDKNWQKRGGECPTIDEENVSGSSRLSCRLHSSRFTAARTSENPSWPCVCAIPCTCSSQLCNTVSSPSYSFDFETFHRDFVCVVLEEYFQRERRGSPSSFVPPRPTLGVCRYCEQRRKMQSRFSPLLFSLFRHGIFGPTVLSHSSHGVLSGAAVGILFDKMREVSQKSMKEKYCSPTHSTSLALSPATSIHPATGVLYRHIPGRAAFLRFTSLDSHEAFVSRDLREVSLISSPLVGKNKKSEVDEGGDEKNSAVEGERRESQSSKLSSGSGLRLARMREALSKKQPYSASTSTSTLTSTTALVSTTETGQGTRDGNGKRMSFANTTQSDLNDTWPGRNSSSQNSGSMSHSYHVSGCDTGYSVSDVFPYSFSDYYASIGERGENDKERKQKEVRQGVRSTRISRRLDPPLSNSRTGVEIRNTTDVHTFSHARTDAHAHSRPPPHGSSFRTYRDNDGSDIDSETNREHEETTDSSSASSVASSPILGARSPSPTLGFLPSLFTSSTSINKTVSDHRISGSSGIVGKDMHFSPPQYSEEYGRNVRLFGLAYGLNRTNELHLHKQKQALVQAQMAAMETSHRLRVAAGNLSETESSSSDGMLASWFKSKLRKDSKKSSAKATKAKATVLTTTSRNIGSGVGATTGKTKAYEVRPAPPPSSLWSHRVCSPDETLDTQHKMEMGIDNDQNDQNGENGENGLVEVDLTSTEVETMMDREGEKRHDEDFDKIIRLYDQSPVMLMIPGAGKYHNRPRSITLTQPSLETQGNDLFGESLLQHPFMNCLRLEEGEVEKRLDDREMNLCVYHNFDSVPCSSSNTSSNISTSPLSFLRPLFFPDDTLVEKDKERSIHSSAAFSSVLPSLPTGPLSCVLVENASAHPTALEYAALPPGCLPQILHGVRLISPRERVSIHNTISKDDNKEKDEWKTKDDACDDDNDDENDGDNNNDHDQHFLFFPPPVYSATETSQLLASYEDIETPSAENIKNSDWNETEATLKHVNSYSVYATASSPDDVFSLPLSHSHLSTPGREQYNGKVLWENAMRMTTEVGNAFRPSPSTEHSASMFFTLFTETSFARARPAGLRTTLLALLLHLSSPSPRKQLPSPSLSVVEQGSDQGIRRNSARVSCSVSASIHWEPPRQRLQNLFFEMDDVMQRKLPSFSGLEWENVENNNENSCNEERNSSYTLSFAATRCNPKFTLPLSPASLELGLERLLTALSTRTRAEGTVTGARLGVGTNPPFSSSSSLGHSFTGPIISTPGEVLTLFASLARNFPVLSFALFPILGQKSESLSLTLPLPPPLGSEEDYTSGVSFPVSPLAFARAILLSLYTRVDVLVKRFGSPRLVQCFSNAHMSKIESNAQTSFSSTRLGVNPESQTKAKSKSFICEDVTSMSVETDVVTCVVASPDWAHFTRLAWLASVVLPADADLSPAQLVYVPLELDEDDEDELRAESEKDKDNEKEPTMQLDAFVGSKRSGRKSSQHHLHHHHQTHTQGRFSSRASSLFNLSDLLLTYGIVHHRFGKNFRKDAQIEAWFNSLHILCPLFVDY